MGTFTLACVVQPTAWSLCALVASAGVEAAEPSTDSPTLAYIEMVKAKNVRYAGNTALVSFDDGEQVPVIKFNGPAGYDVAGPLAEEYETLERAASTRAEVASALANALRACQAAPISQEAIDEETVRIRRSGPVLGEGPQPTLDERVKRTVEVGSYLLKFCEGVTSEQKERADFWLAKAAELGDPIAALNYAERLGDAPEAFPLLEAAWRAGEADALAALARLYRQGQSTPPFRDPDRVKAYTHQYLYVRLMEGMSPTTTKMGRIRSRWLAAARADLETMQRDLRPGEQVSAVAQAKAMLKANANCCQPL